jgi:hypothetical protein
MNRRSFIKGLIALASAPAIGKYINVFKTEGARKGIENVASQGVDFFNMVIKKVMDEGNLINESDRIQTFKHPDRPDINVEVDLGSGSSSVYFDTDQGTKAGAELVKDIEVGPGYTELLENEEVYKTGAGGEVYKDVDEQITGGITNLEKFLKGKKGFAAGGRVGMFRGGVPKGLQAALRAIMSKYGDDAITTADKAPQPEKTIQEQIMDFNARNPNIDPDSEIGIGIRLEEQGKKLANAASDAEIELRGQFPFASEAEIKAMLPKGVKMSTESVEIWENPVKIREAVDDIFPTGDYKYDAQMAAEALVENNPQVFNNMLYDDLDQRTQMKIYGAVVDVVMGNMAKMREMKKLSKPTNTLAAMKAGKGIDMSDPDIAEEFTRFMKENDPKGFKDIEEKVELINFNPKGRKKNADGGSVDGDVSLTVIKIPDISESGVESLFKRR